MVFEKHELLGGSTDLTRFLGHFDFGEFSWKPHDMTVLSRSKKSTGTENQITRFHLKLRFEVGIL